jgi:hypothetical protein
MVALAGQQRLKDLRLGVGQNLVAAIQASGDEARRELPLAMGVALSRRFPRGKSFPAKRSRQKPRDPSTSKWVLHFIMQATTTNVRNRAGKYAAILDGLMQDKVEISAVASRIKELGGIDAAYEAMRARTRE